MRTVTTIGVYGWTAGGFMQALRRAGVGLLLDVRQRRGVRGSEYAWANARRLQQALAAARIDYRHQRELAPTTELRRLQYREDARLGVGKRSRAELAREYRKRYSEEILESVDLTTIVEAMPAGATTALLCVERDAQACHRSIIAERLASEYGVSVTELVPEAT